MRLGKFSYTNCLPVFHALESNRIKTSTELVSEPPTALNQLFSLGQLEVTGVSSIAYARMAADCVILPDLSIASDGAVQSVLLLSKLPVQQLNGKTISVTIESATSVALLTILLESYYRINVKLVPSPKSPEEMLQTTPAVLLIGDKALKALHSHYDLHIYDLGQEWKNFTGEKMVYAVWVAPRSTTVSQPLEIQSIWQSLQQSKTYGLTHPWEIATTGAEITGLSPQVMLNYFRHLSFRLDADYLRGLACFFFHAYRIGLLDTLVKPQIWRGTTDAQADSRQSTGSRAAHI